MYYIKIIQKLYNGLYQLTYEGAKNYCNYTADNGVDAISRGKFLYVEIVYDN